MPNNQIDLKIVDKDDVKYDLNNHIFIKTNLGNVKMDFVDALDIMHALLDATGHLNRDTENIICDIEDTLIS